MRKIFFFAGTLVGKILGIRIFTIIKSFFNVFYSGLLRSTLNTGKNFQIQYPTLIIGSEFIEIGDNFSMCARGRIEVFNSYGVQVFSPKLKIGDNVSIIYDCHIGCIYDIQIGNNVLIASKVFITDHYHGSINSSDLNRHPVLRDLYSKGPVIIEDDVWIGEGVCIMPNITLGKGCIVGANSVVTQSFPAFSVIGGIPARVIKTLTENDL